MIFLDSANLEEIREVYSWGLLKGSTTNQKIFLKGKIGDYKETIQHIATLSPHLSVELTKTDQDDKTLVCEAILLCKLGQGIVIKVPMWGDGRGLRIAKQLMEKGISVNLTCLMGASQAILGVDAGVHFVSLFYNRMADHLRSRRYAQDQISKVRRYIEDNESLTKIIAGSIRDPKDVLECFEAGAHIVTVPFQHLKALPYHPSTENTIREFDSAWDEYQARAREK